MSSRSILLAREVLDEAAKVIGVGVTADEIDRVVHEACIERECYPLPLNYCQFPRSCCTSVNEVICHGIPDLRPLADGDICNVKPGQKYRDIGTVIRRHAQNQGFSVVRSYCGHGIHKLFHTAPYIPHYAGTWRDEMWPDKCTVVTMDGLLSAQFEPTLLVTNDGCEVLTQRRANNGLPYFMDTV